MKDLGELPWGSSLISHLQIRAQVRHAHLLESAAEVLLDALAYLLRDPVAIRFVHQAVVVHAQHLVDPKPLQAFRVIVQSLSDERHALCDQYNASGEQEKRAPPCCQLGV